MPAPLAPSRPRTVLFATANDQMSCARMPQLFAEAGLRVEVLAPPTSPAFGSSHTAGRWPVPPHAPTARRRLRALLVDEPDRFDRVVVCDEDLLRGLARHLDEPWAARCLPVPMASVAMVTGKSAFIAACQAHGVPTPESRVCTTAASAGDAAEALGYPLLLKADFGASGTTVWRIDDGRALLAALPRTSGRAFVLQAYWPDAVSGVTEMLCRGGRVLAVVSSAMGGIDPPPFGTASSRIYRRNAAAEAVAARLAAITGFDGLCGFDWLQRGDDGAFAVLEFHARPTLGFHLAQHAGVDFVPAVRAWADGADREPSPQSEAVVHGLLFPKDLTRALRRRDWAGLGRWVAGPAVHDVPWRDPGLLRALAGRALRRRAPRRPSSVARPAPSLLQQTLAPSTAFGDDL